MLRKSNHFRVSPQFSGGDILFILKKWYTNHFLLAFCRHILYNGFTSIPHGEGKDIVKNIRFEDKTPEGTEFVEQGENGYVPTENPPTDYHLDPNRDKGDATAYAPDSITTVTTSPGDSTDVVIEIRDVVYVGDLKPSAW